MGRMLNFQSLLILTNKYSHFYESRMNIVFPFFRELVSEIFGMYSRSENHRYKRRKNCRVGESCCTIHPQNQVCTSFGVVKDICIMLRNTCNVYILNDYIKLQFLKMRDFSTWRQTWVMMRDSSLVSLQSLLWETKVNWNGVC
jgi:hypothetical protein